MIVLKSTCLTFRNSILSLESTAHGECISQFGTCTKGQSTVFCPSLASTAQVQLSSSALDGARLTNDEYTGIHSGAVVQPPVCTARPP